MLAQSTTGRIGSRQQLAGGVSWGCPRDDRWSFGDHLHPIQLGLHRKSLFVKFGRLFLCACGYVVDLPHVAQVRFWRSKRPHLEKRHLVWQSPSSWDKKLQTIFLPFMGPKVVFWVKKWCFLVSWTGCEVADLKQRY